MTPETEAFLNLTRHAEEPSQEDEQRVLRALQASVAAGLTSSVAMGAWHWGTWLAKGGKVFAGTTAKLSLVAVGIALGLSIERGPTLQQPVTSPTATSQPAMTARRVGTTVAAPLVLSSPPSPRPVRSATVPPVQRKPQSEQVASLRAELMVLEKAQRALKEGDGEGALRELDAARTKDGPLRAERQAARILALCSAGRASEARAAMARFFTDYPGSAHRAAITSGCANL